MAALDNLCSGGIPEASTRLRFIRRLNGSAQSILVEDHNDQLWVLKPKSDLQGPNALANELIGSTLCKSIGLPVPEHKVISVDEMFCRDPRVRLWTRSGHTAVVPGLHFASRFIPDVTGKDAFEFIPSTLQSSIRDTSNCLGMFIFDVWAMHADSRQALFSLEGSELYPIFFDHSHLFGGPAGRTNKPFIDGRLLQRIALASFKDGVLHEQLIKRMEDILPHALHEVINETPVHWFSGELHTLEASLLNRLDSLRPLVDLAFAAVEFRIREICERNQVESQTDFRVLSHRGTVQWA